MRDTVYFTLPTVILIFKKLHLILLSKMEVQTENGDKNYQLTHSQTFTNLLVVLP